MLQNDEEFRRLLALLRLRNKKLQEIAVLNCDIQVIDSKIQEIVKQ